MNTYSRVIAVIAIMFLYIANGSEARSLRIALDADSVVERLDFTPERVRMAPDGFADVHIVGREVHITPRQEGQATLLFYGNNNELLAEWSLIVGHQNESILEAVRELLVDTKGRPFPTLSLNNLSGTTPGMLRITGNVAGKVEIDRLRLVKELFPGRIIDMTEVDTAYFQSLTDQIKQMVPVPGLVVTHVGATIFLRGRIYTEAEKHHAEAIARAIYPNVVSLLELYKDGHGGRIRGGDALEKPLVQLECQIIEVDISDARRRGIDWGGLIPVSISAGWGTERGGGGPSASVSLNTESLVQALIPMITEGKATVHYTQNLVCEHGDTARFFSGASYHIVVAAPNAADFAIEEVEYGIGMNLTPLTDDHDNIRTDVRIEFSGLQGERDTVRGYPSLMKRYVQTSVNVKRGQTLSLAGLMGSEIRDDDSGVALLRKIPGIGRLFRSQRYLKGETEMVILVTPRVVIPGAPENLRLRDRVGDRLPVPRESVTTKAK
jgi:hypothetical protein